MLGVALAGRITLAGEQPESLERALREAGANRTEIARALHEAPERQRGAMRFLVENMPAPDLQTLKAAYLLENAALAHEAFDAAPWRDLIPLPIFLNDILPYASVDESRDHWRRRMHDLAAPLIADCKTPAEAAQRLNQKLFPLTGVHYSTQRRSANQGPLETLDSKIATCTGLSILLVDACRAVGVPARIAGTPLWANERGNHTWVEIWDNGWHFAGAAEPDPAGLDRGWFVHDASQATKDDPRHAIYASSFARTGLAFPMVWSGNVTFVSAVNVTDRYTPNHPANDPGKTRLLVKVLDRPAGLRVKARVTLSSTQNHPSSQEGYSRDESADLNDILPFEIERGRSYEVRVEGAARPQTVRGGTNAQELVIVTLADRPLARLPSQMCYAPPPIKKTLKAPDEKHLRQELAAYFAAPFEEREQWRFPHSLDLLLQENEPAVRRIAWEAYRQSPALEASREDFAQRQVRYGKHLSPYAVKQVGVRPASGWPLFIAMHGGGGVPPEVNDSQWKHMQIYYRDHSEVGGYLYLALRAPNDSWNGFYDTYVYPLVSSLVEQFLAFGEVDPNKVFVMGYSHGGYGAYAIGPKMPDRFAAIHASAAAPTDGETTARTLRNTQFTAMVGDKDTAYGRYDRNLKFRAELQALRGQRTDIYPAAIQVIEGNGHTGLPDRDKIVEMYPAVRNPVPTELTWSLTDEVITDFYWIHCGAPAKKREIDAQIHGNSIKITLSPEVPEITVFVDQRLIDFEKPVALEINGKPLPARRLRPSLRTLCQTLERRGDPELAFSAAVTASPVTNR